MYDGMNIYKAQVVNSSYATGIVYVKIPAILGPSESVAISRLNVTDTFTPTEGSQVLVAVEDSAMTNVYLVTSLSTTTPTAAGGEEFAFFLGDL